MHLFNFYLQVTEQNLISEIIISNKTNEETAHNKTVELRKETALETNLDMDVPGKLQSVIL